MLTTEVFPGEGIGNLLVLGRLLFDTVSRLQEAKHPLEFAYSNTMYLDVPVTVKLPSLGVQLMFSPVRAQQLMLIQVLSFDFVKLSYKGKLLNDIIFSLPSNEELAKIDSQEKLAVAKLLKKVVSPTLLEIYNKIFGPTFPGELNTETKSYTLSYPGIMFEFSLDVPAIWSEVSGISDRNTVVAKLTNWARPAEIQCTSMTLYDGEDFATFLKNARNSSRLPLTSLKPSHPSELTIKALIVTLERGEAQLVFHEDNNKRAETITIGVSSQQDILGILGPPDSSFNKFDSRFLIHKHLRHGMALAPGSGLVYKFHNYFRHGIDFLFNLNPGSSAGGILEKIILHNGGIVELVDFMKWGKCEWVVQTAYNGPSVDSNMYFLDFDEAFVDSVSTRGMEPVLLNRVEFTESDQYELEVVSSHELSDNSLRDDKSRDGVQWGNLKLYGYERCVWEVMESNDCVSCVTIY